MRDIALVAMIVQRSKSGASVFTAHLAKALALMGIRTHLFALTRRKQTEPFTDFAGGLPAAPITLPEVIQLSRSMPTLISYANASHFAGEVRAVLEQRVPFVLHDFAEVNQDVLAGLEGHPRVIVIRETMRDFLRTKGIESTFIPHPYVSHGAAAHNAVKRHARCIGRLDYRKHQEIVCEANLRLPPDRRCWIAGKLANRIFAHILDQNWKGWREQYEGPFPDDFGAAPELAAASDYVVNLTRVAGDSDGTEYVSLEAWNGAMLGQRTVLVVHSSWIRSGKGAIRAMETAIPVTGADDLANLLRAGITSKERARLVEGGVEEMMRHTPQKIVPQYTKLWRTGR